MRAAHVAFVRHILVGRLGFSAKDADAWLEQPNLLLGGASPIECIAAGRDHEVATIASNMGSQALTQ